MNNEPEEVEAVTEDKGQEESEADPFAMSEKLRAEMDRPVVPGPGPGAVGPGG